MKEKWWMPVSSWHCQCNARNERTNLNNITKETYTFDYEVNDDIESSQITENNYEYNSNDYPVRKNDSFEYVYY